MKFCGREHVFHGLNTMQGQWSPSKFEPLKHDYYDYCMSLQSIIMSIYTVREVLRASSNLLITHLKRITHKDYVDITNHVSVRCGFGYSLIWNCTGLKKSCTEIAPHRYWFKFFHTKTALTSLYFELHCFYRSNISN